MRGHVDEVLDICFNSTGTRLVTGSADATARVYNVHTGACIGILTGLLIKFILQDMKEKFLSALLTLKALK